MSHADMQLGFGPDGDVFSKAFKSKVSVDENDVNIQFSGITYCFSCV